MRLYEATIFNNNSNKITIYETVAGGIKSIIFVYITTPTYNKFIIIIT